METRHLLLAFVLLTHTLTTGLWWTAGTWMGLSSRAARYWLIATLGNGVGLCLMLIPGSGPAMLRVLTACSLAALGAIWLRQGLQVFLKLPRAETRQLVLSMALMVFNILICVPLGWQAAGVAVFPGRSGGVHAGRILQLARHRGAGGSSCSGRRKTTRFQVVGCLAWSRPGTGPRTGTPMP